MGFRLKNPLIAGSSGLTAHLENLLGFERQGVGAVVLKSLFEEELLSQFPPAEKRKYPYPLSGEFFNIRLDPEKLDAYLTLIEKAKKQLSIPVIASINCVSSQEWPSFAKKIEAAGADGLELNMFVAPADPLHSSEENEKVYFEVLTNLRRQVAFPLAVKISPYFAGMTRMALKLSWTGISGMVLFNRFYQPDVDIEEMKVISGKVYSTTDEISLPLRWVALLSDRIMCDIAAGTGAHDHTGVIKFLLAGAKAIQATSTFYINGIPQAGVILKGLVDWMERHDFHTLADFMGKLSLKKAENPADYERFQFLKTFGGED